MINNVKYMQMCIELAKHGIGKVSPNPLVGCVIVNDDGEIISTGYHHQCGQNHAERDALLKDENYKGCTLYVNLEPCSHYGKTPPCTDLIIEKGIRKVVYGMQDPNPKVCGSGLEKLRNAGLEIIGPICENECKKLNEIFLKNQIQKEIFVALKTATTIDGKIATQGGDSKWITSKNARDKVKQIRQMYDCILTSSSTILADNPQMIHKTKIILDRELKTNLKHQIYNQGNIYVFYDEKLQKTNNSDKRIVYIPAPTEDCKLDIKYILNKLYELGLMSVLVESGGILNTSFLPYVDKLYHFVAPKILGDNKGKSCFDGNNTDKISQCFNLTYDSTEIFEPDILNIYNK